MVGIVVIAHAPLASALGQCAGHVYSCEPNVRRQLRVLDVDSGAEMTATLARARELVSEANRGQGVLVLTDVFGATPGNVASQLADADQVAVVAGVNLPMLLRAMCYQGERLGDVAEKALAGGRQGMLQIGVAQ